MQLPAWKQGVPRDSGASWDFEDVRDHYLQDVYGVEPTSLRTDDFERYLALSQAATGLVMAETLGEWRRAGSPCAGALIWWLNDVLPGSGWGILDSRGRPKPAYWIARRSLAPLAVWTTDEGTNGIAVHIANDTADEVDAVVDVRLLRDSEQVVAHGERAIRLGPRAAIEDDVESILGRFVDAGYTYRFGSPQHDVVAVTLLSEGRIVSQTARFPLGRKPLPEPAPHLGITAIAETDGDGGFTVELTTRRVAEGVCVSAPDLVADDAWLLLIPGFRHKLRLQPVRAGQDGEWHGGRVDVPGGGGSIAISSTGG